MLGLLSEFVSEDCAKSIPLGIVDTREEFTKRKHLASEEAINKMARKPELSKVSKSQKLKRINLVVQRIILLKRRINLKMHQQKKQHQDQQQQHFQSQP